MLAREPPSKSDATALSWLHTACAALLCPHALPPLSRSLAVRHTTALRLSRAGSLPGRSLALLTRTYNTHTQRIREASGCDGVMIGRAAIDSPWVFRELTGQAPPGSWPDVAEVDDAVAEFHSWGDQHDDAIKTRFAHPPPRATVSNFHAQNFRRIRRQVCPSPYVWLRRTVGLRVS